MSSKKALAPTVKKALAPTVKKALDRTASRSSLRSLITALWTSSCSFRASSLAASCTQIQP
jgi:hypothetical protein